MRVLCASVLVFLCTVVSAQNFLVNAPPSCVNRTQSSTSDGRSKRAVTCGSPTRLTQSNAEEAVFIHNLFRQSEVGTNLLHMTWSEELAAQAQALASTCTWGHGVLVDCSNNPLGQNLYITSGSRSFPPLNMTAAIKSWQDERNDYNYGSGTCNSGKVCGHYTQVVNARSSKLGCGAAQCATVSIGPGVTWNNALIVVCNYSPPGNVMGRPIYQYGTPCSNCDSELTGAGFKCVNNLCASCNPGTDPSCRCGNPLPCQNGGVWVDATCSCSCPSRFYGTKCEKSCLCQDAHPTACPQWSVYCTNPDYVDFMTDNCMGTCRNLCTPPPSCRL